MNTPGIRLGIDGVSMLNPPTEGIVIDQQGRKWNIGRTGSGNIMLRPDFSGFQSHPEFLPDGMDLLSFCQWINNNL